MSTGQQRSKSGLVATLGRRIAGIVDRPGRPATREDLWRALRDVVERHNDPLFGQVQAPPRGYLPITREDLAYYLGEIDLLLQRLGSRDTPVAQDNQKTQSMLVSNASYTWTLEQQSVDPTALVLENTTSQVIEDVYLSVNAQRADNLAFLLRMALGNADPRDGSRAFAIYDFCCRHGRHGPPPGNDREDLDVLDPVRFFHGFGYGLCGFRANTFAILCALAGMRCRVWNIGVHTFPEVMIDTEWCILDPDAEVWFRDAQGKLIGFEALRRDPDYYLGRVRMTPWYETRRSDLLGALKRPECGRVVAQGHELLDRIQECPLTMGLRLLPFERVSFLYQATSPWHSTRRIFPVFSPPPHLGHMVSEIDVGRALPNTISNGLTSGEQGEIEIQENGAFLDLELHDAYPILDAELVLVSEDAEVLSGIQITVTRGQESKTVRVTDEVRTKRTYRLRRALIGSAAGEKARVRILFGQRGRLSSACIKSTYQASPLMMPHFLPGDNELKLVARSEIESAALHVELRYSLGSDHLRTRPIALNPQDRSTLSRGESLDWSTPQADKALEYRCRIRSEESTLPLAPQFDLVVRGPRLSISNEDWKLFQRGVLYVWEVCSVDSQGRSVSEWSEPAHFFVSQ